jgi:hypothetical protein
MSRARKEAALFRDCCFRADADCAERLHPRLRRRVPYRRPRRVHRQSAAALPRRPHRTVPRDLQPPRRRGPLSRSTRGPWRGSVGCEFRLGAADMPSRAKRHPGQTLSPSSAPRSLVVETPTRSGRRGWRRREDCISELVRPSGEGRRIAADVKLDRSVLLAGHGDAVRRVGPRANREHQQRLAVVLVRADLDLGRRGDWGDRPGASATVRAVSA